MFSCFFALVSVPAPWTFGKNNLITIRSDYAALQLPMILLANIAVFYGVGILLFGLILTLGYWLISKMRSANPKQRPATTGGAKPSKNQSYIATLYNDGMTHFGQQRFFEAAVLLERALSHTSKYPADLSHSQIIEAVAALERAIMDPKWKRVDTEKKGAALLAIANNRSRLEKCARGDAPKIRNEADLACKNAFGTTPDSAHDSIVVITIRSELGDKQVTGPKSMATSGATAYCNVLKEYGISSRCEERLD